MCLLRIPSKGQSICSELHTSRLGVGLKTWNIPQWNSEEIMSLPLRLNMNGDRRHFIFEGTSCVYFHDRKLGHGLLKAMKRSNIPHHQLAFSGKSSDSLGVFVDQLYMLLCLPDNADETCSVVLKLAQAASQKAIAHALAFYQILRTTFSNPM